MSDSAVSLLNWCNTTADVASRSFSDRNWSKELFSAIGIATTTARPAARRMPRSKNTETTGSESVLFIIGLRLTAYARSSPQPFVHDLPAGQLWLLGDERPQHRARVRQQLLPILGKPKAPVARCKSRSAVAIAGGDPQRSANRDACTGLRSGLATGPAHTPSGLPETGPAKRRYVPNS